MTEPECGSGSKSTREGRRRGGGGGGKASIVMICGSLVYYHCAYRNSSIVSLVLLCSLGLLFRHIIIEYLIGAAESVLRVAATGHDKRLFLKVVASLYLLSALGRLVSGVTVAYTGT